MQNNIINFNETKTQDILDRFAICKYDNFEILYLKENQYFNTNFISKQLNEKKINKTDKFLQTVKTQEYIDQLTQEIGNAENGVAEFYIKIEKDGLTNEQCYLTGYYLHQRLLQQFICWVDVKKQIIYDKILMKQLQTKQATQILEQIVIQQEHKVIQQENKIESVQNKINKMNVWKIFIEQENNSFKIISRKSGYKSKRADIENLPNANAILNKFRIIFRENIKRNDVVNMTKEQILKELQTIIQNETRI